MTLPEVKAWAHVKESGGSIFETVDPEGYRSLGKCGWLRELAPVVKPQRTIYRFELTLAGTIQREADRPLKAIEQD